MELDGIQLVVLRTPKQLCDSSTAFSLYRNHDPITQDKPQTSFAEQFPLETSQPYHCIEGGVHLLVDERLDK